MQVHITTDNHIQGKEKLTQEVEATVRNSLTRFDPQIMRVEVFLSDQNSHKSSQNDKMCKLEARLSGLQPVAVSDTGDNLDQAVSGAVDKLVTLLDRKLGRLGERKGRESFGGEQQ
jgi:ribosome-associated translation inhibitor RaiA